ncbi:DNA-binding transcriptional regulator [Desulfobacula sp.]|uniref:helix-turn-helix domain-containing protein n=1 Tax=Desulfobacula sp. TaxID=2593537 RepID=UPI00262183E9|nr:helix-turn-helix transcriptional regulator [Desulfobacula sp.]
MTIEPEKFSKIVKEVRRQLGFSQEDLARALGVSFATVNRWENGKTNPSKMARNVFKQLCKNKIESNELNLSGDEI